MSILYILFSVILLFLILIIIRNKNTFYKQYVMISACEPYTLYLPLVINGWSKIGYRCIIVLVYKRITNKLKFILSYISKTNSIIIHLVVKENDDIINISKLARIFAFINQSIDSSSILLTADADILPINKSYYTYNNNINNIILKSFGINGYGKYPANKRWPMSYIMMTLRNWKIILKNELNMCRSIISCVNIITKNAYKKKIDYYGGSFSCIDEIYMRDNIRNSYFFPSLITFDIHGSYDRKSCKYINNKIKNDIHLPRIKADNLWVSYIYCILNELGDGNDIRMYISQYSVKFNASLIT